MFHRFRTATIISFLTIKVHVSYASKKAPKEVKDHINMMCVTLEGLWIVGD